MRRRHFLQLAAGAAAAAIVEHASPAAAQPISLRIAQDVTLKGVVVNTCATAPVTKAIAFPEQEHCLGVSGWISPDGPMDLIHVMLERRPEEPWSYPAIEFPRLQPGRRYRIRVMNATPSAIPVYLPGRRVELTRYSVVETDLIAAI